MARFRDAVVVVSGDQRVVETAEAFLAAAWGVLERQNVVPTPAFHPFIEVGRDYFGPDLAELPEYQAFAQALTEAAPRFSDDLPLMERDFPGGYVFSFLETFVARTCCAQEGFSASGPVAAETVEDLLAYLAAETSEVASCRVVSHLTTAEDTAVQLGEVTVVPLGDRARHQDAHPVIADVLPGAASAYARTPPFVFAPPESVVVARKTGPKPFDLLNPATSKIDGFLLLVRLLWAGTCDSVYEVRGETSPVRRAKPDLLRFRGTGPTPTGQTTVVRRVVRLGPDDAERLEGLSSTLASAEKERPGMAVTSFGLAVEKFQLSYHAHTWYEQVVDLATAFEAALSGSDNSDVMLRLRSRAAALLAVDNDPAETIFADVGKLYALRSSLVHGGELTVKTLTKMIGSVSTVPMEATGVVAYGHVVDRLRDLVRRALLARICLGAGDDPVWSLASDVAVDAQLSNDRTRAEWRQIWRDRLASFDAVFAADKPRRAVWAVSTDDY